MTDNARPLRMALIGGGGAGFIGKVHATAATLDRQAELVAGALSSDPARSKSSAAAFGIADDRAYGSFQELIDAEREREPDDRVDFVSIATPNQTHCHIACAALDAGFHVVCDKPMTTNIADAEMMVNRVEHSNRVFALTHNYSGYPMMRQAREMIAAGEIGDVIAVRGTYVQGWMHSMQRDEQARSRRVEIGPDKSEWPRRITRRHRHARVSSGDAVRYRSLPQAPAAE